jgi:WD40 repeat protein
MNTLGSFGAARSVSSSAPSSLSLGLRFLLVSVTAALGLAGCAVTPGSAPATQSATRSSAAPATANPTATLSPTPVLSPTPAPPLSFVATGDMHTARVSATATLLQNGRVLIAGGYSTPDLTWTFYASAEIYDPATGKFTTTGSMSAARANATATLLADGRVLIAGGQGCSNPKHCTNIRSGDIQQDLLSADIYDPATGRFTGTGSMTGALATYSTVATLLPDGRVLIAGLDVGLAELYDPTTGKFVRTGKEAPVGSPMTSTLLPNSKVLVTGSSDGLDTVAQLYDLASGRFTTISLALPAGAQAPSRGFDRQPPETATLLKDGRVLLFEGGYTETYDPATGACADAGFISPGDQWDFPTATLLPDGRVLFEGGILGWSATSARPHTNTAVLLDPTGGPTRTGSTQVARQGQTATLLPDGSVLIAGGQSTDGDPFASAELFKP